MIEVENRDELQTLGKKAFLDLPSKRGTAMIGTGLGKSALAVKIAKELQPEKILLLTNSERLRDVDWEREFEKFGFPWSTVEAECYQTVYKWKDKEFPFVIADEIDFAMSEKYSEFFVNNKIHTLLGLTAFATEDKEIMLKEIAPPFIRYSTQQGQKDDLLNKTKFYEVRFMLSTKKTIRIDYKDKKTKQDKFFYQSENDMYKYLEEQVNKALIELQIAKKKEMKANLLHSGVETTKKGVERAEGKFNMFVRKRTTFLHNLESSLKVAQLLKGKILDKNPSSKIIIFSALSKQIDKICEHTYHMKNNDPELIEKLNQGEINTLGVVKKINRGVNLIGVNHLIKESYVGSETDFQQQHGRGVRLDVKDTMYFYTLIPYYENRIKIINKGIATYKTEVSPTQAKRWADKMSSSFDMSGCKILDFTKLSL